MTGVLDRQAVMEVLRNYEVGRRVPMPQEANEAYRESIASAVMALAEQAAPMDMQQAGVYALRLAALAQRRLAADARTDVGMTESEDIADWIDGFADALSSDGFDSIVAIFRSVRDKSHTAAEKGAIDRCIAALTGGAR